MSRGRFLGIVVAIGALHLALATSIAPVDDELYYWCWSQELQPSYFDHPPLTAILIRLSTILFGDTLLGVRFFACLSMTGILLLIGSMTNRRGLLWLMLTPMVSVGCILMTPDSPMLFFWTAYAYWLVKMQDRNQAGRIAWSSWAIGGVLLGLGGLSKYTMALAAPSAFAAFVLAPNRSQISWRWGFAFHLFLSVVIVSPVLIFNSWHEFIPLRYQLAHASRGGNSFFSLAMLGEYLGCQFILIGGLPFLLVPWIVRERKELLENGLLRVSACLFLLPWLFFLVKSGMGRVEGNWPFISYMTLAPLSLHWFSQLHEGTWKRWSLPTAFAAPGVLTVVLVLHCLLHLPLPASIDRLAKGEARYEAAQRIARWAKSEGIGKIYGVNYQLTSHLRFQHMAATQFPGLCRPSHFTMHPDNWRDAQDIYVLWYVEKGSKPPVLPTDDFLAPQVVATFAEIINGEAGGDYKVVRYEHAATLPNDRVSITHRQTSIAPVR